MVLSDRQKKLWVVVISLVFIVLNTILITFEVYWFTILPAVVLLLAMYFLSLEKIFFLVVLITPLSVDLPLKEFGMNLTLPTEPLLMGMLLLLLLKFLHQNPFKREMWFHPVSVIIVLQLTWMLVTSFTSEIPMVSFKYFVMQLWFIIPVYFFGILVFREERNIRLFLILFLITLAAVVVYTTYHHSLLSFDGQAAHWVMYPFFNDHTAYGAILAMFLPVGIVFSLDHQYSRTIRLLFVALTLIILTGIILSVSRAAWLSVAAALGFFAILFFRIRFRTLILGALVLFTLVMVFQNRIVERLEKNTQESEETDLARHAQSMSNITTDASNLERLNRWNAAYSMFLERPFWGWGPGTYQFVYAPFQKSSDLTIISTNFGELGSVHSEYIGPLCHSGIIGAVLFPALVILVISVTLKLLRGNLTKRLKLYLMAVFLGLSTYYVHGILNDFLETDKAAIPFWGFTAIIIAIDLYHSGRNSKEVVSDEGSDVRVSQ